MHRGIVRLKQDMVFPKLLHNVFSKYFYDISLILRSWTIENRPRRKVHKNMPLFLSSLLGNPRHCVVCVVTFKSVLVLTSLRTASNL